MGLWRYVVNHDTPYPDFWKGYGESAYTVVQISAQRKRTLISNEAALLTDFQRVEMAHHCEDAIRRKARERQAEYYGNQYSGLMEKSPEVRADGITARDELGKMAGVSGFTYSHAVTVLESAPEAVKDAVSLPCEPGSGFPEIWITADFVLQKSVEQKPIIAAEAEKRKLSTLKQNTDTQKSAERWDAGETRDELAKVAGVSSACGRFCPSGYRSSPEPLRGLWRPVGAWEVCESHS